MRWRQITHTEKHIVMTRLQIAAMLGRHPDTVSHLLRTDRAFAGCLLDRGGRGKEQTFDATLVLKWHVARQFPQAFAGEFLDGLASGVEQGDSA